MAHSRSALKRWRQSERRHERNVSVRSAVRAQVRKATRVVQTAGEAAEEAVATAASALDRAARKRVIHRNQANRLKSRLTRKLNAAS